MPPTVPPPPVYTFTLLDWSIVIGYLVLTTWLGGRLAGKQSTIRDFFLGGRKLPWWAVSGSIIATEISAVTFISVPSIVFRPGGDFTYLQLGLIGTFLARLVVGYVLVPAYYQREIYSPYDYAGQRLGSGVRGMTTALFSLGGVLAQASRVYLTAIVLDLILGDTLFGTLANATGYSTEAWAIWTIGFVAVAWTLMGGITTVIWTDVILFFVFLIGALAALATVIGHVDGGFAEVLRAGSAAGKFRFFDADTDPTKTFTIWTAAFASAFGNIGAYGTDQLMAQRMFCCRDAAAARKAVISSIAGQIVTITVLLVGVGLFAYYRQHPLSDRSAELVAERADRVFPIFIIEVIPPGLTGLIIAGIFAAAISSLDSILAALSQTSVSALYVPLRARFGDPAAAVASAEAERRLVRVGRGFVVFWGIVLSAVAVGMRRVAEEYPSILDLALAMAQYCWGGLLAGFFLGFLPLRVNGHGFLFSAPASVLFVYALNWHGSDAATVCRIGAGALFAAWLAAGLARRPRALVPKTLALAAALAGVLWVQRYGFFLRPAAAADGAAALLPANLAWPWQAPAGFLVAFVLGWLLADPKPSPDTTR